MNLHDLKNSRQEKLEKLANIPGWVIGSLVETTRKQGKRTSPFRYLSHSIDGRNKITYVSEKQMAAFEQAVENGRQARRLLEEIAGLTTKIIKAEAKGEK